MLRARRIDRNEDIVRLYRAGRKPKAIAKLVGVSESSVYRILQEMGVEPRQQQHHIKKHGVTESHDEAVARAGVKF
jgi:transposase-like protein